VLGRAYLWPWEARISALDRPVRVGKEGREVGGGGGWEG